ncbi:DNA-directed RNA polymerase subunit delta [Apilactobacillus kunkeei]|nr:DNA-directed RNA polymerase subunit delta [Apilactobacillus kunkeei]KOY70334.1 putative DNA-directed RNA polymerase subunit delta [Apilactobacillus kunkeei]MCK8634238.1 DNA-directed RNA polymerase subunit delta [Apilactobacillus kunkeei]CAI2566959.1 DNA-directed RNA polymerase subunit delta [Apilactobacillus kunkeei]CAI2567404.1 DNA-directed RNA polymerase subunit delta [Apilactobacillus kunkeei]CAI2567533.1 DNA-directed RNA polymerase subunit delta [Apilactobacillus kunkeei]
MKLQALEGKDKKELSMVEVAHAILSERGEVMAFADIANEIQKYLGDSDEEIRKRLVQFYTDMNVDGSFISLGDNLWGLRTWYPYDSIDEATVHPEDEDIDRPRKKKRRKVNAFLADASDDDDVIDYDDDDPEDQDDEFEDADEGVDETDKYHKDLDEIDEENDVDDDNIPDGIEGELSELHDEDDDIDDDSKD